MKTEVHLELVVNSEEDIM
jgi:hypothetical protein